MNGTVVIASQTAGTLPIMQPFGRCTLYIVHRTHLAALPTLDAGVRIDGKLPVRDHLLVEIPANDVGIESGSGTFLKTLDAALTISDHLRDALQLQFSIFYFPALLLLSVCVHEGQAYIRLGHRHGEERHCLQSDGR